MTRDIKIEELKVMLKESEELKEKQKKYDDKAKQFPEWSHERIFYNERSDQYRRAKSVIEREIVKLKTMLLY